jgi:quinoprotein glucose dehydrogenase
MTFLLLSSKKIRSHRLSVRTRGFHPRKRGSIPLGTAIITMKKTFFLFFCFFVINISILFSSETDKINLYSHKFSELEKINSNNVQNLELAWIFKGKEIFEKNGTNNQTTPIFTGNSIVTSSLNGKLISIDPLNGNLKWEIKLRQPIARRGLTYFENNLYVPTSQGIVVINSETGSINTKFGKDGYIGYYGEDFLSLVPPIIDKNSLIVAHQKKIEKYLLPNGKTLWSLNLNGARIWSPISYSEKFKTIAVSSSNLINLIGETNIDPDFSNSLILINSENGKVKCKFKDVLHDHWDLDMVGAPIMFNKKVYGFSKTGTIFSIDMETCTMTNSDDFEKISTKTLSDFKNQTYSSYQNIYSKKKNIINLEYNLDEYINYLGDSKEAIEYIKFKTRNANYKKMFNPININNDVVMNGIHGGFEWPGGTLDMINNQLIITSNHYPWILRGFYSSKKKNNNSVLNRLSDYFTKNEGRKIYLQKCQSCHKYNREGEYQNEFYGDKYVPSLIGISLKTNFTNFKNLDWLKYQHKYSDDLEITIDELTKLKNYFTEADNLLKKESLLTERAVWQLLLDKNGIFASPPPWGKITSFDLETLDINWQIPFGIKSIKDKEVKGDINFGGVMSTRGNVFFATGTADKYVRAFNSKNGKQLWSYKMKQAGSSPPMTFNYKNKQYLIINASGGKFYGYENQNSDMIYAFVNSN